MNNCEEQRDSPDLPVEMWMEVLKYLSNYRELSLVSKTVHEAVKSIRYNNIFASIDCSDVKSSIESVEEKVQNQFELNIQLISPNICILDFLQKYGNRVKVLKNKVKIREKCKLKDILDILKLVPNCESLDIASIDLSDDKYHSDDIIMMMKLNDIHINLYNESYDILINHLSLPVLNKLSVGFTLESLQKINKILNKNPQLKVLRMSGKSNKQSTDFMLSSLKNLTLDTINIERESFEDADMLLRNLLENQPQLKNLQAYHICKSEVEAICTYAPQLDSLKITTFYCNREILAKLANLTNLRKLSLSHMMNIRRDDSSIVEPDFFLQLAKNNKQFQHLELDEQFLNHKSSLSIILTHFKQLESLKISGDYKTLFKSVDSYLSLDIDNANLKVLKLYDNIPLKLFGKFIFSYPNLEILETRSFDIVPETSESEIKIPKIDGSQMMLDLIEKAKELTYDRKTVIADLIESVIKIEKIFSASDLLKLLLTLIQLGWPNLKELEIQSREIFADIDDQIEDLLNANQDLQSIKIQGHYKFYNEEKYKEKFNEKFQDRFNKITNEDYSLSLMNISEQMKVIEIKNYSKCETVSKDERIRNIQLNFNKESAENEQMFKSFMRYIKNFGGKFLNLELTGSLNGDQIFELLSFVPNCEVLYLNDFHLNSNMSHIITMKKLKEIKVYLYGKLLKFLHVPKLNSLIIKELDYWRNRREIFSLFLKDQKSLMILELDIFRLCGDVIDEDFLLPCKLIQLKLNYEDYIEDKNRSETERRVLNILIDQTELNSLEIGYITNDILKIIIKDLKILKILKFKTSAISFSDTNFGVCPNVYFLQCQDKFDNSKELAQIFPNVKVLKSCNDSVSFQNLLETIKHFQHLESLTIRSRAYNYLTEDYHNDLPSFINSNLRELIYDFRSLKTRVDILLKCLPNLNKLSLCIFGGEAHENEKSQILKGLFECSNNIEYCYCIGSINFKVNPAEFEAFALKDNLKFLCLERFTVEISENLLKTLENSFEIVKTDDYGILLIKNKEILQKLLDSLWKEVSNKSNYYLKLSLSMAKEQREKHE